MSARFFLQVLGFVLFCTDTVMSSPMPVALQPRSFESADQTYRLQVDPDSRWGLGGADYKFFQGEKRLWQKTFPFTLREANIDSEGSIFGHAMVRTEEFRHQLVCGLISATGEILSQQTYLREPSRLVGASPIPPSPRLISHSNIDKVILMFSSDEEKPWWIFDRTTGERISQVSPAKPAPESRCWIDDCEVIPDTPLLLVRWQAHFDNARHHFISITNHRGELIWKEGATEDSADLAKRAVSSGFQTVQQTESIHYSVAKENGVWKVHEVKRTPFSPEEEIAPTNQVPALPRISLQRVGSTRLQTKRNLGPMEVIRDYTAGLLGEYCVLTEVSDGPPVLKLIDESGQEVASSLSVSDSPDELLRSEVAHLGERRFLLCASKPFDSVWYFVDFADGSIEQKRDRQTPQVLRIAGFPDGQFAALTEEKRGGSSVDGLYFFSATAEPLWNIRTHGKSDAADELFSPVDICAYGENEIAVLDVIAHSVQFFHHSGQLNRAIDLDDIWKKKPKYTTEIFAFPNGDLIIDDFGKFIKISAEGKQLQRWRPISPDNEQLTSLSGPVVSSESVSFADESAIIRLGKTRGDASQLIYGSSPGAILEAESGNAHVGISGRIYLSDRRTRAIQVFSAEGKKLHRIAAQWEDEPTISENANGGCVVLVGLDGAYHHFDSQGQLIVSKTESDSVVLSRLHYSDDSDRIWRINYDSIDILNDSDEVIKTIERDSNNRWLNSIRGAACSANGTLAVLTEVDTPISQGPGPYELTLYSASGAVIQTFDIPLTERVFHLAFNGEFILIRLKDEVVMYRTSGAPVGTFRLPDMKNKYHWTGPSFGKDSKSIQFVDTQKLEVIRYGWDNDTVE